MKFDLVDFDHSFSTPTILTPQILEPGSYLLSFFMQMNLIYFQDVVFMDEINNECTILVPKSRKTMAAQGKAHIIEVV